MTAMHGGVAGPCLRHLNDVVGRYAPWLRAFVAGLSGLLGLLTTSAAGLPLAVTVVAVALPVLQTRHRRTAPGLLLAANAVAIPAIGMSQLALGPRPSTAWVYAIVSVMSATCHFEWPERPWAACGIAVLGVLGYCAGSHFAGGGVAVADGVRLVVQAALARTGLHLAHRAARITDEMAERAARHRVEASAALAQRSAGRAYLAMLHDTASTTLLMVSRNESGDFGWLREQALRDLDRLASPVQRPGEDVDLARLLRSFAGHLDLEVALDLPEELVVPADAGLAISHGVREALENVRRHAGDPRPRLSAWRGGSAVFVRLRDDGRGFTQEEVAPHRRGLTHSVRARVAAVGGRADIRSAPGQGTTVEWTWPSA